jgi:hypothetical protein
MTLRALPSFTPTHYSLVTTRSEAAFRREDQGLTESSARAETRRLSLK